MMAANVSCAVFRRGCGGPMRVELKWVYRMGIRPMCGEIPSGRSQYVNMLGGHKSDLLPRGSSPLVRIRSGCVWVGVEM